MSTEVSLVWFLQALYRPDCDAYLRRRAADVATDMLAQTLERRTTLCDDCRRATTYLEEEQRAAELSRRYPHEIWPLLAASVSEGVMLAIAGIVRLLETPGAAEKIETLFEAEIYPRFIACMHRDIDLLPALRALVEPT